MWVRRLELADFRNYRHLRLEPGRGITTLAGENGQGKTNLLEALYVLATGRSWRSGRDAEMVRWGCDRAAIRAEVVVEQSGAQRRIEVHLPAGPAAGAKRMRVNGTPVRRYADLFGHVQVVLFAPEDLELVKGSPSARRRFLDVGMAQISSSYRHHLLNYHRVLQQRNTALRTGRPPLADLEVWDEQLARLGAEVMVRRAAAVRNLGALAAPFYARLAFAREQLQLEYVPFFERLGLPAPAWEGATDPVQACARAIAEALEELRGREIAAGRSLVGPQLDDIRVRIAGSDARAFGSQGQQRSAVLACKLAQVALMREETGENPLLLLDDVLSELDPGRQERLLEAIPAGTQVLITTAQPGHLRQGILGGGKVFRVQGGEMEPVAPGALS